MPFIRLHQRSYSGGEPTKLLLNVAVIDSVESTEPEPGARLEIHQTSVCRVIESPDEVERLIAEAEARGR